MSTEKELGAIRVMEALSAVDGELLERSEKAGAAVSGENKKAVPKGNRRRGYVYRYAMACAACLCLIVAGTVYYTLSHVRPGSTGNGGAGKKAAENEFCAAEDMPQAAEAEGGESDGQTAGGYGDLQFSGHEPEWLDISRLAVLPETYGIGEGKSGTENVPAEKASDELQKEQAENLQEIREVERQQDSGVSRDPGADAVVPAGYILEKTEPGREEPGGQESCLYKWTDGDLVLWLKITWTELTADMRFEADPPVCTVRQEWAEMLPDAGENGIVRFALLYENGMLAEYCGVLEKDETVRLLESLVP